MPHSNMNFCLIYYFWLGWVIPSSAQGVTLGSSGVGGRLWCWDGILETALRAGIQTFETFTCTM